MNKFLKENKVSKMTNEQRNAWYAGLTKPQKAVAICEDVLAQIAAEKYIMEHGTYLKITLDDEMSQHSVNNTLKKEKLEDLVASKGISCEVCAMGSAFMSAVRLGNNCNAQELLEIGDIGLVVDAWGNKEQAYQPGEEFAVADDAMEDKLQEAFTEREYRAMEYMFEGSDIQDTFYYDEDNSYDILDNFYYGHFDQEAMTEAEQMQKMCQMIIDAKGYFLIPGVDLGNLDK